VKSPWESETCSSRKPQKDKEEESLVESKACGSARWELQSRNELSTCRLLGVRQPAPFSPAALLLPHWLSPGNWLGAQGSGPRGR
jgi:hypothetical protein